MAGDTGTAAARREPYTSETLLAVAVEVFLRQGYDGTSMEDLAGAAGISKSSIYHHVRGKEQLLSLALARALDGLFATLDEPGATEGRAIDRLEHVARRTTEVLMTELPYVTLLLRVHGNTDIERRALERRREFDHEMAKLVAEAAEQGDLRTDVEPHLATRLLFGMINSIGEWYHPRDGGTSPEVTDGVVRVAFHGLRTR